MNICVSVGVAHLSSLINRYSDEPLVFLAAYNSFNRFVCQRIDFDAME